MPVNGKPNDGRFQLSLAPVNYSLTDGTDIPPPQASPIEEKPPAAAAKPDHINTTASAPTSTDATGGAATNGNGARTAIAANDVPTSPTRPSSIRRFLSRKSLNTNYNNGTIHNGAASQEDLTRPETSGSLATTNGGSRPGGLAKQKSGGWFRKLTGSSGGNRNSVLVVMEEKQPPKEIKKGPPPPKLPELNQLKAKIPEDDEGSLGGEDMFKNIQ